MNGRRTTRHFLGVVLAGFFTVMAISMTSRTTSADEEAVFARQPRGPSFDCSRTRRTRVEMHICKNAILARLDLELNDAYADDAFDSSDTLGVVRREAAWLVSRNACTNDACLENRYRRRIMHLRADLAREEQAVRRDWRHPAPKDPLLVSMLARQAGWSCFQLRFRVDLGDGRDSLIGFYIDARSPDVCKKAQRLIGGDYRTRAILLHPDRGRYRVVFDESSFYVTGICCFAQTERSHGLRRIATFSRSVVGEYYLKLYDFDGQRYREIATVDEQTVWNGGGHKLLTITHP